MKKQYISPQISISEIALEESIAAGSALIDPRDSNGQVQEQWIQDDDADFHFDWGS